jgi:hypothetical protein
MSIAHAPATVSPIEASLFLYFNKQVARFDLFSGHDFDTDNPAGTLGVSVLHMKLRDARSQAMDTFVLTFRSPALSPTFPFSWQTD